MVVLRVGPLGRQSSVVDLKMCSISFVLFVVGAKSEAFADTSNHVTRHATDSESHRVESLLFLSNRACLSTS